MLAFSLISVGKCTFTQNNHSWLKEFDFWKVNTIKYPMHIYSVTISSLIKWILNTRQMRFYYEHKQEEDRPQKCFLKPIFMFMAVLHSSRWPLTALWFGHVFSGAPVFMSQFIHYFSVHISDCSLDRLELDGKNCSEACFGCELTWHNIRDFIAELQWTHMCNTRVGVKKL